MKRALRHSLWIPVVATVLTAVAGGMVGYSLARATVRQELFAKLVRDARVNGDVVTSFFDESHALLQVLNASGGSFCSEKEIEVFRQLIYHSRNLRDAGRIRDGRLVCSAVFGAKNLPATHYLPSVTRPDGAKLYRNIEPYVSKKVVVLVMQEGDSFVAEDPNFDSHFKDQGILNTETTMVDAATNRVGRPNGLQSGIPNAIKDRDWQGYDGDWLYVTRCVPRDYLCSSAYNSLNAAIWGDHRGQVVSYSALGSLSGVLAVLLLTLLRQRNRSLQQQLRRAIRKDTVQLVYQPIVDLANGKIIAAEALSRWTDEDGFPVSPDVFVRLAEERGFINELTEMVVRQALRDFRELFRQDRGFRLNVNVSASDLADPGFLPMLQRSLAEAGVEARCLAIELTESSTASKEVAVEVIRQLRQRGHCVQLDDFGTGYSSLAYLKDLAVDAIKIDRSFTQAIGTESVIGSILPQIMAMAQSLELQVIVEGIETVEQADHFAALEMPILGQGWLFGRPVSADVFHAKLIQAEQRDEAMEYSI